MMQIAAPLQGETKHFMGNIIGAHCSMSVRVMFFDRIKHETVFFGH